MNGTRETERDREIPLPTFHVDFRARQRIYADCPTKVRANFAARAKAEGMKMDEAFEKIVTAYACGDFEVLDRHEKRVKTLDNFYSMAHAARVMA